MSRGDNLLQQIITQNVLSKCMKEARSLHKLVESIPMTKICLPILSDTDILEYLVLESVKVLAIQMDQHKSLTKLAECKTLRSIFIYKERQNGWKPTNGERSVLINRLLQEQRCLKRIQIADVTLETTSVIYLLCKLKTLESAVHVFNNVKCQNTNGEINRKKCHEIFKAVVCAYVSGHSWYNLRSTES